MKKKILSITAFFVCVASCSFVYAGFWDQVQGMSKELLSSKAAAVSQQDVIGGLKDALQVGSDTVVSTLGREDAFLKNKAIHIPLPEGFTTVQKALSSVGMSGMLDDLELRLNRAAEACVPKAKPVFTKAIQDMTFEDAMKIYKGPDDSATRYFEEKMTSSLRETMRPLVDDSLAQAGAVTAYDSVMGNYQALPFVPDVKADMTTHVLDRSLNAIFDYLAKEEAAIRHDPLKQTTSLLQKIFGSK